MSLAVAEAACEVQSEFRIVSPYFVPAKPELQILKDLRLSVMEVRRHRISRAWLPERTHVDLNMTPSLLKHGGNPLLKQRLRCSIFERVGTAKK